MSPRQSLRCSCHQKQQVRVLTRVRFGRKLPSQADHFRMEINIPHTESSARCGAVGWWVIGVLSREGLGPIGGASTALRTARWSSVQRSSAPVDGSRLGPKGEGPQQAGAVDGRTRQPRSQLGRNPYWASNSPFSRLARWAAAEQSTRRTRSAWRCAPVLRST